MFFFLFLFVDNLFNYNTERVQTTGGRYWGIFTHHKSFSFFFVDNLFNYNRERVQKKGGRRKILKTEKVKKNKMLLHMAALQSSVNWSNSPTKSTQPLRTTWKARKVILSPKKKITVQKLITKTLSIPHPKAPKLEKQPRHQSTFTSLCTIHLSQGC